MYSGQALLSTIFISHANKYYCGTMSGNLEALGPIETQVNLDFIKYHSQLKSILIQIELLVEVFCCKVTEH